MRKMTSLALAMWLLAMNAVPMAALAEAAQQPAGASDKGIAQQEGAAQPPAKPEGEMPEGMGEMGEPPAMPEGGMPEGMGEMGEPPAMPEGEMPEGMGEMGEPPAMPEGGMPEGMGEMGEPPAKPEGGMPGGMGGMGGPGGSSQPASYEAVTVIDEDTALTGGLVESTGKDENAVLITGGQATLEDVQIVRNSAESTGGDTSSFYGVGAAVLATGGETTLTGGTIETDAAGGAGVFAYGDGVVNVSGMSIVTRQDTSGGVHVAGGGTLHAQDLVVETYGESSAAIRSDRGSGTMTVDGGTYVSRGVGSPAVYVTADITIRDAALSATDSEALCLEGRNTVRLYDCDLTGNMEDLSQNDSTWTVILYQSMSGDSEVGKGHFEMSGGSLVSGNGGLFYTTNTQSEFILSGVALASAADSEYLLRCTGNQNARGWGRSGDNGAQCTFTAIAQQMAGDVIWDSISQLDLYVTQGSTLTGAVVQDESCAGEGGDGQCSLYIDEHSSWVVTGDSYVTNLLCSGSISDEAGNAVSVVGGNGEVFCEGTSPYTVTVATYSAHCDASGAGVLSSWEAQTAL